MREVGGQGSWTRQGNARNPVCRGHREPRERNFTQTQPVSRVPASVPVSPASLSHVLIHTPISPEKELVVDTQAVFSLPHHKPLSKLMHTATFNRCALPSRGRTDTWDVPVSPTPDRAVVDSQACAVSSWAPARAHGCVQGTSRAALGELSKREDGDRGGTWAATCRWGAPWEETVAGRGSPREPSYKEQKLGQLPARPARPRCGLTRVPLVVLQHVDLLRELAVALLALVLLDAFVQLHVVTQRVFGLHACRGRAHY